MCQSRLDNAIPDPGGHLTAHLRYVVPSCHSRQSGHLANQQGLSPSWGHTLSARVKVEDTSSGSDRTPARGHRIQGTLVTGVNGI